MATPRLGNWISRPKDGSWALELTNGAYDGVYCFVQFVSRNVVVKAIGTAARTRNPGLGAHRGRMTNEDSHRLSTRAAPSGLYFGGNSCRNPASPHKQSLRAAARNSIFPFPGCKKHSIFNFEGHSGDGRVRGEAEVTGWLEPLMLSPAKAPQLPAAGS